MRTKLATVLVIPSLAFMVVAGVQTSALIGQATVLDEFADQVALGQEVTTLVHDLQSERDRTAGNLAALQARKMTANQATADIRQYYVAVDRSAAEFREAADPLASGDAAWQVALNRARDAVDDLPTLRGAVAGGAVSADTVIGNYTRTIDALLTLLAQPSPGVERPELTEMVLRYVELARIKEIGSRLRARLYAAASAGDYGPTDQVELTDLRAQQLTALADFRVAATNDQILRYERAAADPKFGAAVAMEQTTIATGSGEAKVLEPFRWWSLSQDRHDLLRQVETDVLGDAVDEAGARSGDQLRQTLLVAGSVLAVLLIALVISVMIGRSVARSLRELRRHALHVAQDELPDAIERLRGVGHGVPTIEVPPSTVRSMDEVGEVAEAFVAVHRSAVDLAVEQAVMRRNVNAMFVNLARRSQVLVERQLELLDELEREEGDPDQLANLFKLDHLAARMRRNDESLLVLAGTESSRRWNEPVALSAVAMAAAAEIEQYPRVRHEAVDNLYVVGHAVADVVHLLAELLENATNFSAPFTQVKMTTRAASGRTGAVEIVDEGLGMSEAALEEANALLAEPPAADVAASERMGLFVVSHLAARHAIRVRLVAAERGIIASIWLPPSLLAPAPPARALPEPPARPVLAAVAAVPDSVTRELRLAAAPAPRPGVPQRAPAPALPAAEAGAAARARRGLTRAEDVLKSAGATATETGSTWWSRQGGGRAGGLNGGPAAMPPAATGPGGPTPPSVPITGGTMANGLPLRVPMAQLPPVDEQPRPAAPVPTSRVEPDPEAVGSMLSKYYSGVRRAEAEDSDDLRRTINQEANST
ncbi:nitrate- and nitrite sensing domain-containing protein [Phytohabitans sp. ZYX-F-186]|uniref:histidine kinase n=1 Tax=Phytohabitans maris TaxID=3071409 RepID=A0ABU0ZDA0_9ACTN|nr:nitrate- and nitrite sensing domain-containing protein [Phytohabitans sp. ZYX-F-186]MDQ7904371.1 nitrate- and nitrite sensing domain-containing protein [Phytohabitans sp. ZYX-F-186]